MASLGFHSDKRCVKWAMLQWRASQQGWERGEGVIEPKKKGIGSDSARHTELSFTIIET